MPQPQQTQTSAGLTRTQTGDFVCELTLNPSVPAADRVAGALDDRLDCGLGVRFGQNTQQADGTADRLLLESRARPVC